MRRVMLPIDVVLRDGHPHTVRWRDDHTLPAREHRERVAHDIDEWRYVGRWWEQEVRRDYFLVETERGRTLELYREGDAWCLSRTSD